MSENTVKASVGIPSLEEARKLLKAGKPAQTVVSKTTVNEHASHPQSFPLDAVLKPHEGRLVIRLDQNRKPKLFWATGVKYSTNMIRSREGGHIGHPDIRKNIYVVGLDVQTDDTGKARYSKVQNPLFKEGSDEPEFIDSDIPELETKDADGKPIEAFEGFQLKAFLGRDSGRSPEHSRKNVDVLILLAGTNCPTKSTKSKTGRTFRNIDWDGMIGFEKEIYAPILDAEMLEDQEMLTWINSHGGIPKTSNAPSLQKDAEASGEGLNFKAPEGNLADAEAEVFEAAPVGLED